jgi:hypothetical protein
VIFERAMDEKKLKSGDMAAFRNMSPLTMPQKDLHINSNGAKIYKRRRVSIFGHHFNYKDTKYRLSSDVYVLLVLLVCSLCNFYRNCNCNKRCCASEVDSPVELF